MARRDQKGIQLGSSMCIIRNNVMVNNGSMSVNVYGNKKGLDNRIYHNIFYKNEIGVYINTRDSVYGNVHKNNIFFQNIVIETFSPDRLVWGSGTPEIVDAHMEGHTEAERTKVKGSNLAKLLGFA